MNRTRRMLLGAVAAAVLGFNLGLAGGAADFKKATERLYHDKAGSSGIVLGVLER